jgi:hypothetical protein
MHARLISAPVLLAAVGCAADTQPACSMAGAVFGMDPLGESVLLKDSGGYFRNVKVTASTTAVKLSLGPEGSRTAIRVADLTTGDLVCVRGGSVEAVQLSVVARADLHRAQLAFLADWQRDGVYGTLSAIDISGRKLLVSPLPPSKEHSPVQVSVPASARLRAALHEARLITDSSSFQLEELRVGEPVYVRGSRESGQQELAATLVLKGGYRAILGILAEVRVFDSAVQIMEFGTGRSLRMKITPGQIYRTTENLTDPMRVVTQSGAVLAPVGFADLQAGDAILVIGRTNDGSAEGDGVIAVTKFGAFGVLPQDPQKNAIWLLEK